MHRQTQITAALAAAALSTTATPVLAEVTEAHDDHFITRAEAVVEADAKATWLALISPARWWAGEHTWSADAANLRLTPQAGGCFCETIPEVNEPGRFTLEGSVEHMRVIQAYPEVALRMSGALGPLQSEPVGGILTIALSEDGEGRGTRIVWEYNVGGKMRYPVPVISQAVDGVMTLQLTRLADLLGTVVSPQEASAAAAAEREAQAAALPDDAGPEATDPNELGNADTPASIETESVIEEEQPPAPTAVDEAFGDLNG